MRKKIILASSSPRRIEMMQKNGFNPSDKQYWVEKGWTKGKRPWK